MSQRRQHKLQINHGQLAGRHSLRAALALVLSLGLGGAWLRAGSAAAASPTFARLNAPAQQQGQAWVIVTLNLGGSFQPDALVGAGDAPAQRAAISAAQASLEDTLAGHSSAVRRYPYIPAMALSVDELARSPLVAHISEDLQLTPALTISVPATHADQLHQAGNNGQGWDVVIADSGIDPGQLAFQDDAGHSRIVAGAEACFSTNPQTQTYTVSLCGNGQDTQIGPGSSELTDALMAACIDLCNHGVMVASVAAGNGNGAHLFVGMAPAAGIIPVQVFHIDSCYSPFLGHNVPCMVSYTTDILAALQYVYGIRAQYPIAAVNLSLGGGGYSDAASCVADDPALAMAVDQVTAAGIAVVAASGNHALRGQITEPACLPNVIAVAASNHANTDIWEEVIDYAPAGGPDQIRQSLALPSDATATPFVFPTPSAHRIGSNLSNEVALAAPGNSVVVASSGDQWGSATGTSLAAPHVSGAIALLREADPKAPVWTLRNALQVTGRPIIHDGYTMPFIDVPAAAQYLRQHPLQNVYLPSVGR